jgi:hypothetical protein
MERVRFRRVELHWEEVALYRDGPTVYVFERGRALRVLRRPEGGWLVGDPDHEPAYPTLREAIEAAIRERAWVEIPVERPFWIRMLRRGTVGEAASAARQILRRRWGME